MIIKEEMVQFFYIHTEGDPATNKHQCQIKLKNNFIKIVDLDLKSINLLLLALKRPRKEYDHTFSKADALLTQIFTNTLK